MPIRKIQIGFEPAPRGPHWAQGKPIFILVRTHNECPPIAIRHFDWSAVDDGTYCGDEADMIGHGPTEEAAIADLISQMQD